MVRLILLFYFILSFSFDSFSQESPVEKKTWIITGSFSYTSNSISETDQDLNSLTFSNSTNYMCARHFFVGLFSFSSIGFDKENTDYQFDLGPQIGFMWGRDSGTFFPFYTMGLGYSYITSKSKGHVNYWADGGVISFSAGVLIKLNKNVALVLQPNLSLYSMSQNFGGARLTTNGIGPPLEENKNNRVSSINFSVGFSGLFY